MVPNGVSALPRFWSLPLKAQPPLYSKIFLAPSLKHPAPPVGKKIISTPEFPRNTAIFGLIENFVANVTQMRL